MKNNMVFDIGSEVELCYDGDRLIPTPAKELDPFL
jgi:hypothetical protein